MYRFILKRVRDKETAEDIVQEVLLKAYAKQETLNNPTKLQPWLYQITRNVIVDFYRSEKCTEALPDEPLGESMNEDDISAQRELTCCITPLLDQLPDTYSHALRLTELEGATQREVASRLGLSLSGAKSRVQRGRVMLREALLKCCRVELDRRGGIMEYEARGRCDSCSSQC